MEKNISLIYIYIYTYHVSILWRVLKNTKSQTSKSCTQVSQKGIRAPTVGRVVVSSNIVCHVLFAQCLDPRWMLLEDYEFSFQFWSLWHHGIMATLWRHVYKIYTKVSYLFKRTSKRRDPFKGSAMRAASGLWQATLQHDGPWRHGGGLQLSKCYADGG